MFLLFRLTVCFVVVACSDATLVLRAIILPCRLWYGIFIQEPLSCSLDVSFFPLFISLFRTNVFLLLLSYCRFDVALLVPLSSPVLALQHVIVPISLPSEG